MSRQRRELIACLGSEGTPEFVFAHLSDLRPLINIGDDACMTDDRTETSPDYLELIEAQFSDAEGLARLWARIDSDFSLTQPEREQLTDRITFYFSDYHARSGGDWCTWEPVHLKIRIGGFPGTSYRVEYDGESLMYQAHRGPEAEAELELHPSPGAWMRFWDRVERLDVWHWRPQYRLDDQVVLDGTDWEIMLANRECSVLSSGDNAYPPDPPPPGHPRAQVAGPETSRRFDDFLAAVRDLLGGDLAFA